MIGVPDELKASFYTAALNPDIDRIIESVNFGREYTHFLKIKLDAQVEKGFQILQRLHKEIGSPSIKKQVDILSSLSNHLHSIVVHRCKLWYIFNVSLHTNRNKHGLLKSQRNFWRFWRLHHSMSTCTC
jgi:hypothetical protein